MIWHPLALAIVLADLLSMVVCASAAFRLFKLLPGWQPESGSRSQLKRERDLELSSYQGNWIFRLQMVAGVLVVLAVSIVWPRYVPGAMCGTGVMQAMEPAGVHALVYRALLLLLLFSWRVLQQLDAADPQTPLAGLHGRILLLSAPLMVLSLAAACQALATAAGQEPVSCCAVVYDRVHGPHAPGLLNALSPVVWMVACLCGAIPVAAWARIQIKRPLSFPIGAYIGMGTFTVVWVVVAMIALQNGFSAYIYEVLQHPCPWCLFLPEHGAVGFLLFGLLALVTAECIAGLITRATVHHHPRLTAAAHQRLRRAGFGLLAGTLGFVLLAVGPAIIWRMRFGVWLH